MSVKGSRRIISALVLTLVLTGLTVAALAAPGAHELIKPDQLKGLLHSNNVVVIDVRDATAYSAGNIPGAVWVDKDDFYEDVTFTIDDTTYTVGSMAASPEKLAGLLSSIGVTPLTHVVIYSTAANTKIATRLWWVLEMYGHKNAQVLEGGIEAWTASGYPTSTESVTPVAADYPASELVVNDDMVATLNEVQNRSQETVLVDCRSLTAYNTKHIPGAILVPELDMYHGDGTLKDKQELRSYFSAIGITDKTPVITYCNTGTTATLQYLALTKILGCKDVQNYDGSLTEWNALGLPIEP